MEADQKAVKFRDEDLRKRASIRHASEEQIIDMRRVWSWCLFGILVFEALATFALVLVSGLSPGFRERIGGVLLETYVVKFAAEILAMPFIVVKFLFSKEATPE